MVSFLSSGAPEVPGPGLRNASIRAPPRTAVPRRASASQQAVLDRVLSYHPGAEVDTTREELRRAAQEVGVEVEDASAEEKARQISTADPAQG
jgi:hypothetical protein